MYTRHLSFASTKPENDSRKPRYGSLVCISHCSCVVLFSSIPSVIPAAFIFAIIVYSEGQRLLLPMGVPCSFLFYFPLSESYLALVLFFLFFYLSCFFLMEGVGMV